MRPPRHAKEFLQTIADGVIPIVVSVMKKGNQKEIGESMLNALAGDPGTRPNKPPPMTRDERFAVQLFRHFIEVHSCIERMKDFDTYFHRFPFARTRVTRQAYLQLILEAHLNEIYLLRERLVAFAKFMGKAFRNDVESKRYIAYSKALEKFAVDSLAPFTSARGSHTHQYRYSHDDVDRLGLISILQIAPDPSFKATMRALKREAAAESQSRLRAQARQWNARVAKIIDEYFKALMPLLFDEKKVGPRFPNAK